LNGYDEDKQSMKPDFEINVFQKEPNVTQTEWIGIIKDDFLKRVAETEKGCAI
jgi:hypothetical protein